MKKLVIMGLALMMATFTFAQKKELKEAEKAIRSNNYSSAKSAIESAEAMMSSMDDKTKAKYYFLKGQAYYANGAGNDAEIAEALKSFKQLTDLEAKTGKKVYTPKASELKVTMSNAFLERAQNAFNSKDHKAAAINFERAYRTSNVDTLYLYNAAVLATSSGNYDKALELYDELNKLRYTGVSMEYKATDIESGEVQTFPNKAMRDISVKAKTHNMPKDVKTNSKVGEMAKNVALIYIEQGQSDKALQAIEDAKKSNPNDFNLLVSEANVRYKLGEKDKYKMLINKALELEPNNADLLFNLGVVSADQDELEDAKKYYNQAIKVDATYVKAYMNMAALILDQEQKIIDEMNTLGTSAADDKKYEQLQEDRLDLYREAIPYLSSALENDTKNINAAKTLMNIYSVLGDDANFKAMQAKVAEMEGN